MRLGVVANEVSPPGDLTDDFGMLALPRVSAAEALGRHEEERADARSVERVQQRDREPSRRTVVEGQQEHSMGHGTGYRHAAGESCTDDVPIDSANRFVDGFWCGRHVRRWWRERCRLTIGPYRLDPDRYRRTRLKGGKSSARNERDQTEHGPAKPHHGVEIV